ncbi:MAG: endopeptidase La [Zetaproteobacteria bacterium]|nr:MAG: endopeptidase La [Zetaproteobacteria bacterium]
MIVPLFVGREKSVRALEEAMQSGKTALLVTQKDASVDQPRAEDLFTVGCVGTILQLLKLPDGTIKVLIEGGARAEVESFVTDEPYLTARYHVLAERAEDADDLDVIMRSVVQKFEAYAKLNPKLPPEVMVSVSAIEDATKLADTIASHLNLSVADKQALLEMPGSVARLEQLYAHMESEIELLQVDKRIRSRVKRQMEKSQREYYLNEQLKAIQKELGEDDAEGELEALAEKIEQAGLSAEAKEKAKTELKRLKMMPAMSAEATVVRTYLEWLTEIPWKRRSRLCRDLSRAEAILEADHYGLEKIKERILEHLAVLRLVRKMKGQILCLVGPPGVGKTSLARSIARASNRKFVRISLGGMRDEAEIRGHRRTYIGSMPGKIIQAMRKAGTRNPLILLDEIDKLGADFRGDPSSALLEVLDPEQNAAFNDHYLEVDYDLSEVLFIATANSMNIPAPLMDRMEVIQLPGYTEHEKLAIARRYLLPGQLREHGLDADMLDLDDEALLRIIRLYTREAGVRGLNRQIARICRRLALERVTGKAVGPVRLSGADVERYLGVPRYRFGIAEQEDQIGMVTGLAWTEVGGELLQIETALMPGKGKLTITGQLGDVMQESVQAALTYVRSRASRLGLKEDFHQKVDIHVHVPEGAIPKDGPSAGLAMATSMVSALTGIPVRRSVCMTGEITLRGKALPIGGLKEKLLAAQRGGLTDVIIPKENERDLKDIDEDVLVGLAIHAVEHMDEVLEYALTRLPRGVRMPDGFVADPVLDIHQGDSPATAH